MTLIICWRVRLKVHYLTRPEGDEGTEGEAGLNLSPGHLSHSSTEADGEGARRGGLNLDLGHFEGAESDIGEDLSGCGTSKPDEGFVLFGKLLTRKVHVGILEDLIETVLEHSLERITDEGGAETFPDTVLTLLSDERLKTGDEALVFYGVDLASTTCK